MKTFLKLIMAFCAFLGFAASGQCAIDTQLTTLVTDMTTYWGTIQTLVLAVVIFGIAIAFAKRLKSR